MARIKLEMPLHFIATTIIPVRISDINYGNHVGNDAFVSLIHETRMQWLDAHGYTELKIETAGLIMSDLVVEFKNEARYGDQVRVQLGVGEISKQWFELFYKLSRIENAKAPNEEIVLAFAKTTMVCYNYDEKKVTSIPIPLKVLLEATPLP